MNPSSLLALLLLSALVLTASRAPADSKPTPRQQYAALEQEYDSARSKYFQDYSNASEKEREKLTYPSPEQFSDRFIALAKAHPEDPAALDALIWVATNCRQNKSLDASLDLLMSKYLTSPALTNVSRALVYSDSPKAGEFLRALLKASPHHAVKGPAAYSLGRYLLGKDHGRAEAEKLFEEVAASGADLPAYRGTYADLAKGELFEMQHLGIGQVAPEIVGKNVDGKETKLSDYRGKVVVIDFWGDW